MVDGLGNDSCISLVIPTTSALSSRIDLISIQSVLASAKHRNSGVI